MPTITASIDGSAVKAQSLAGNRRLQPLRYLHDCSDRFRLERLPGGTCTHWKAPSLHGARQKRPSACLPVGIIEVSYLLFWPCIDALEVSGHFAGGVSRNITLQNPAGPFLADD